MHNCTQKHSLPLFHFGTGNLLSFLIYNGEKAGGTVVPISPKAVDMTTPMRVLVVDDESKLGMAIKRLLGRRFDVCFVTSGKDAIEKLSVEDYDVIVCDIMMPEMTGRELYEIIERDFSDMAEKVVFMSGGAFTEKERGFANEIRSRLLAKPLERDELIEALESVA